LYLIDEETRDKTAVMISCSMFSTGVSVCSGDGLVFLRAFDQGIAHVINDVSVVLNIPFEAANMLVNEAVLSVRMNQDDNYQVMVDSRKAKFSAGTVNDIIRSRMEVMGDSIVRLISSADSKLLQNPIFICGGNLDAVGGARDFFAKTIGAHIAQCVCPLTKQNKPSELTILSLVNLALLQEGL
jgi:cell division ATPase FtsA